jgi:hypothetical protein
VSCAGAGSVEVTGADVQARNASPESPVSRPDPRGAARDRRSHRDAPRRVLEVMGRFRSTLLWILRSHAARPLRPFSEAPRREPATVCQQPPVVGSTQFGNRRHSRPTQSTRLSEPWQSTSRPRPSQASRAIVSCRPVLAGGQAVAKDSSVRASGEVRGSEPGAVRDLQCRRRGTHG